MTEETKFLKEGDIIEIKEGHTVYAKVPFHLGFSNCKGNWELKETYVRVGGNFGYLIGKYRVIHTGVGGGGRNFDGGFPNGHRVYCQKLLNKTDDPEYAKIEHRINFYQSGSFTAMIKDIQPIDARKLKITVED